MKCRIIWRTGIADANGQFCGFEYKSDVIELPDNANVFQFHSTPYPECVGVEWFDEKEVKK